MKSQLLKEVSEKIIKAVPEIRELNFGCELKMEYSGTVIVFKDEKPYPKIINLDGEIFSTTEEFEIIGRPITLEDVLRAVDNLERIVLMDSLLSDNKTKWILGQPLSNQSEETLEWLNKIL